MNTNTNTNKKSCNIVLVLGCQYSVSQCQTKTATQWLHVHKQTKENTRYKFLTAQLVQILGFWDDTSQICMKLPMIQNCLRPPSSGLSKRQKAHSKHQKSTYQSTSSHKPEDLNLTKKQSFKNESPALLCSYYHN